MTDNLKKFLLWTGSATAVIASIVYIIFVTILVLGFNQKLEQDKLIVFTAISGSAGVVIVTSLFSQGISLARNEPNAKKILKKYKSFQVKKEAKVRPISFHFFIELIKNIIFKGLGVAFTTYLSIKFIVEGIKDTKYIGLAVANVFIFIGFGLMSLVKGFEKYTDNHLVYLRIKIGGLENELSKSIERTNRSRLPSYGRQRKIGIVTGLFGFDRNFRKRHPRIAAKAY